ncbi:MAG: hypothetical protein OEU46_21915 [Alphaproteobacteria bacterium]|nr:hypothetical protein [Alphaproteobacteria bacterium]
MNGQVTLSVSDTAMKVYLFLWETRTDLLRIAAVPVLLLSILVVVMRTLLADQPAPAEQQIRIGLPHIVLWFASIVFYVMFAVACHRRCLKSDEASTIWTAIRWDRRKSRYLLRWLLAGIVAAISAAPVLILILIIAPTAAGFSSLGGGGGGASGGIVLLGMLGMLIIISLVNGRLALWLPAAAIDEELNLAAAWILGTGNTWRLFGVFLFSMAPGMLVLTLVSSAMEFLGRTFGLTDSLSYLFILTLMTNAAHYIVIAATVIALSLCYQALRRPADPGMPFHMN